MKAFKTFALCPVEQRPNPPVPLEWPWQTIDCEAAQQAQYEAVGYTVLSDADYAAYLGARQAVYDAWYADYLLWSETDPAHVRRSIVQTRAWVDDLMERVKTLNIINNYDTASAIWLHSRFRKITFTVTQSNVDAYAPLGPFIGLTLSVDLINLIATGDAAAAYGILCCTEPDDMTESYHCLTQALIDYIKSEIAAYLGIV